MTYKDDSESGRTYPTKVSTDSFPDTKTSSYEGRGWWYEEYAADNAGSRTSRVLNGMMFAVLAIYDYYVYTGDPAAKYLFDKGVVALRNDLPFYDDNGYSYYDILQTPASEKYHEIHIESLQRLYDITGENVFNEYYHEWSTHRS